MGFNNFAGVFHLAASIILASILKPALAFNTTNATVFAPANIEIDIILPRNDTYGWADSFPIVFAIQNNIAAQRFGGFIFTWVLRPYNGGLGTGGNFWIDYAQYY